MKFIVQNKSKYTWFSCLFTSTTIFSPFPAIGMLLWNSPFTHIPISVQQPCKTYIHLARMCIYLHISKRENRRERALCTSFLARSPHLPSALVLILCGFQNNCSNYVCAPECECFPLVSFEGRVLYTSTHKHQQTTQPHTSLCVNVCVCACSSVCVCVCV